MYPTKFLEMTPSFSCPHSSLQCSSNLISPDLFLSETFHLAKSKRAALSFSVLPLLLQFVEAAF